MKKSFITLLILFLGFSTALANESVQKIWYRAIIKCEEYKDYDSALNDIQQNLAFADKQGLSYSMRVLELRILGKQKKYSLLEEKSIELQNIMSNNTNLGNFYRRTAPYYEACAAFASGKYEKAIEKFKESTSGLSSDIFWTASEGIARSYWNMGQKQSAINRLNRMPIYTAESIADLNTYPDKIIWKRSDAKFLEYALNEPLYEGMLRYNAGDIYSFKEYLSTH